MEERAVGITITIICALLAIAAQFLGLPDNAKQAITTLSFAGLGVFLSGFFYRRS